jgi:hypothetical protein
VLDRHQINRKIRDIITENRVPDGEIPSINIARMTRDLIAHMDETVQAALAEKG